ncbi:NlpC/P60 family protein [Nonomuraea sp. NPDC047897]|uniref:C40 family peptidase n=1 Tax=Nonomuraea sp. NPDC047897 TaxID=3364346 RepID=UPI00371B47C1
MSPHSVSRLCRASLTIGGGLLAGLTTLAGTASAAETRRPPHTLPGPCYGTLTLPAAYAGLLDAWHPSSTPAPDDPVAAVQAAEATLFTARPAIGGRHNPPVQIVLTLPAEACAALHPFADSLTRAGVQAVPDVHLPVLDVEEPDIPRRDPGPAPALTTPEIRHPATRAPQPPDPSQSTTAKTPHPRTPSTLSPRPPRPVRADHSRPPRAPGLGRPRPPRPVGTRPPTTPGTRTTTPGTRPPTTPGTRPPTTPGTRPPTTPRSRTTTPETNAPETPKTRAPGRTSSTPKGDIAAAAALARLGTPFSWGGGSPAGPTRGIGRGAATTGFDCSGLTLYAWSRAGVKLGHYTGTQFRQGRRVPLRGLRRGDLVFFGGGAGDPTHVGLYLGGGVMVHAPKTGDVVRRTSFLDSTYYRPIYRGAVRPG